MEFGDLSFLMGVFFCLGLSLAFGGFMGMAIFDTLKYILKQK